MPPTLAAKGFVAELVKISRRMGLRAQRANRTTGCGPVDRLRFLVDRGGLARGCAQRSATYETYRRVFGESVLFRGLLT
ncbi:hypothetical protein XI06_24635 [Bradyrhizobium sp. CCBAU 11434]|nr:hypothetical protein [Bradyrhizobium sp. CCBAU 11434]